MAPFDKMSVAERQQMMEGLGSLTGLPMRPRAEKGKKKR